MQKIMVSSTWPPGPSSSGPAPSEALLFNPAPGKEVSRDIGRLNRTRGFENASKGCSRCASEFPKPLIIELHSLVSRFITYITVLAAGDNRFIMPR